MDMIVLNLKQDLPTVEWALARLEIEVENAKIFKIPAIKVIHGYGSHGAGGAIGKAVREKVVFWKKTKFISDYIVGDEWDIANSKAQSLLKRLPNQAIDEDLNHTNVGITILVLN